MPSTEFEIIERHFSGHALGREGVELGPGDDCALLSQRPGHWLAVSVDTSVAGVHFAAETEPDDIGYRALAVNLSDLAAMGAEPAWFLLALTLPAADESWLVAFSAGLLGLAAEHRLPLVGGDITRGPLSVCIQIGGWVPEGEGLRRAGARAGDRVYVTGTLGDAAAALRLGREGAAGAGERAFLHARLRRPTPRIAAGLALRGLASSCIDVSDGLLADLGHILERSGCGASLRSDALPLSAALRQLVPETAEREALALGGGDDYELCFTAPPARAAEIEAQLARVDCPVTAIGTIEARPGLRVSAADGVPRPLGQLGYRHFE